MDGDTKRAILALYRATDDPGGEPARMLSAALRPLDHPALVVWGRNDPYIPIEQAERQRETFPSARVVVLDRSGHWPFVDDLEGVARPLLQFLHEATGVSARQGG
jgi:pimeloyl-ACP methyl ester carboxylesterase